MLGSASPSPMATSSTDGVGCVAPGVEDGDPTAACTGVAVGVDCAAAVGTDVGLGAVVGERIGPTTGRGVGVAVGAAVAFGVGVAVGAAVAFGVGVAVGAAVAFGVGVAVGAAVAFGVGVGVAVGAAVAFGVGVGVAVGAAVGDVDGVGVGEAVGLAVGAGPAAQIGLEMRLVSIVTAPLRASTRPLTFTPVVTVIEVSARMFPTNWSRFPSVAELPTCQKTLQASAPLMRSTMLPVAVMSVVAVWKMNTASGSPSRVEREGSGDPEGARGGVVDAGLQRLPAELRPDECCRSTGGSVGVRKVEVALRLKSDAVGDVQRPGEDHGVRARAETGNSRPGMQADVSDDRRGLLCS